MPDIGTDRVQYEGERVVIDAAERMDWPVREYCRVPIWFRERKYYLRSARSAGRGRRVIYELWPWPADLHESSAQSVFYDEAYVGERDGQATHQRRGDRFHLALLPLYPFLGLLWSGFKCRTLGPMGFEPISITKASVALTFNLFVLEGIFAGWLGGGILVYFGGNPALQWVDWLLLIVLGADSSMRFGQSLKLDFEEPWGFCEWLWSRKR